MLQSRPRQLNAQMTAYQRMLKFGKVWQWQWIHSLRIYINLIDSETIGLLTYHFQPTETAHEHPITHHWTIDWDVATIIQSNRSIDILIMVLDGFRW